MRSLAPTAGPALRSWTKHPLPSARVASAIVTVPQRRSQSEYTPTSSFESPFKGQEYSPTTKIPSFKKYMSKSPETSNRVFQYFMVGSMGLLAAAGAKATVQGEKEDGALQAGCWERKMSSLDGSLFLILKWLMMGFTQHRFPRKHVSVGRRPRPSQSRNRPLCNSRRQERMFTTHTSLSALFSLSLG